MGYAKVQDKFWLQKNGVGRGGAIESVAKSTGRLLEKQRVIECCENGFPSSKYTLTEGCMVAGDQSGVSIPEQKEGNDEWSRP